MNKFIINAVLGLAALALFGFIGAAQTSVRKDGKSLPYKVGQVWSYKTRATEPESTFVVVKIDSDPTYGIIIHIAVRGLKMNNPRSTDGFSHKINQMPFSEKAIAESAVKLLKEKADLPDFEEGYNLWRGAFDQKQAGFYTVSVAEAVKIAEQTLNQ